MLASKKLRFRRFSALNHGQYAQKGKFLQRYDYRYGFYGDMPRTSIMRFADSMGIQTEWASGNGNGWANVYFNDITLKHFVDAVAPENNQFEEVIDEKKALAIDAKWQLKYEYRLIIDGEKLTESEARKMLDGYDYELRTYEDFNRDTRPYTREQFVAGILTNDSRVGVLVMNLVEGTISETREEEYVARLASTSESFSRLGDGA